MKALTDRQARVLSFVIDFQDREGLPPSRSDIAAGLGFRSINAAVDHLRALEKKGYIETQPHRSRGLRILKTPNGEQIEAHPALGTHQGLPVIGRVAAGSPVLAEAHHQGHMDINPAMFTPRADYLLKVKGLSMKDAGILDEDLLAVHKTTQALNGQIVVARLDGEVTAKRFFRHDNGKITLMAENPEFAPIEVDETMPDFQIEGRVVGVIRNGI
jgi:repressor LexA